MKNKNSVLIKTIDKIIKYGICVLSFLIILAFYLKTYDSCQIKITLLHLGGTFFIALWLIKIVEQKGIKFYPRLLAIPLAYVLMNIISFFHSPYFYTSLEELIRRILYLGIFLIGFYELSDEKSLSRIINWILVATLISCIYGLIQAQGADPFAWKGAFGNRVFSTGGNPNFFGAFLGLFAPLSLALFFKSHKKYYIILYLLIAVNIFLTRSKAAYISLAAGTVVFCLYGIFFIFHARRQQIIRFMVYFCTFLVVGTVLSVSYLLLGRIDSVRFRLITWLSTCEMIEEHPVIGTGLGTFKTVYPAYRRPEIFRIEGKHNTETDHPENEYIEIWYEDGIIGFGLFLGLLVLVFSIGTTQLIKNKTLRSPPEQSYYLVGILSGLFALLVHNFMCVNLRFVSSGFFFWLFMGLIVGQAKPKNDLLPTTEKSPQKKWWQWITQLGIGGIAIYLMVYLFGYYLADLHHNLAIAYSKAGMWDMALKEYDTVTKYNPGFVMAYYFKGNVYSDRWDLEKQDPQKALQAYAKVKELAPNYVQTHFYEGSVYAKLQEYEKAIECFNKYLELDPIFPDTYFRMGWCYVQMGKWEEAEKTYLNAVIWNPKLDTAWMNLGNVRFMRGKYDLAKESYKKAILLNPKNLGARRNLALSYEHTNQPELARQQWAEILKLDPNNQEAKQKLGIL